MKITFEIVVPQAGTLTVETTGDTDTIGELLDSSGRRLAQNDDGSDLNFQIVHQVQGGTYTVKVTGWNGSTGPYTLVVSFTASTARFAPANQAAFDQLVVGKRGINPDEPGRVFYYDFPSAGRCIIVEEDRLGSLRLSGTTGYRNTGPNAGTLTITFDSGTIDGSEIPGIAGEFCTIQLTFTSATTGTAQETCSFGLQASFRWQLIDIP